VFLGPVTLATAGTPYSIYSQTEGASPVYVAHAVSITNDSANSSGVLYIGDSNVSSTVYGYSLSAGNTLSLTEVFNSVQLDSIFMTGSTDSMKVDLMCLEV
jgi:hypothetical protein